MNKDIKLNITNLTVEEVNNILAGLQELPAKICNPLTKKIVQESQEQIELLKESDTSE